MRYGVFSVVAVAVLGIAAGIWLRGSSGATVHGVVSPASAGFAVLSPTASSYAGCARFSPRPGAHVTITAPSSKVIGSGTLGTWSHATTRTGGGIAYTCSMPFTITGVPHESSYGFQITDVPGTIWVSDVSKPVALDLSRS
jgi:hypothetical protein